MLELTKVYELKPLHNRQKSYYGKAEVIDQSGTLWLKSYNTIVASINKNSGVFLRHWHGYSATTARHIYDFRLQNGLKDICKKEWDKLSIEHCYLTDYARV